MNTRACPGFHLGGGAAHISFEEEGVGKTDIISYKIKQKTIMKTVFINHFKYNNIIRGVAKT